VKILGFDPGSVATGWGVVIFASGPLVLEGLSPVTRVKSSQHVST